MHENFVLSLIVLFTMLFAWYKITRIRDDFRLSSWYFGCMEEAGYCQNDAYRDWDGEKEVCGLHGDDCPHLVTDAEYQLMCDALDRCGSKFWHKHLGSIMEWDTW